jgi:hypothetical protein
MDVSANVTENVDQPTQESTQKLSEVKVENEVMALNILVSFLAQAQKRGAFSMDESAKIWECVKWFQK